MWEGEGEINVEIRAFQNVGHNTLGVLCAKCASL